MHYVYLIETTRESRQRYIGCTSDLRRRLADHNAGKGVYTSRGGQWQLRTYVAFSSKGQALVFERYLKSGSGHAFANKRLW